MHFSWQYIQQYLSATYRKYLINFVQLLCKTFFSLMFKNWNVRYIWTNVVNWHINAQEWMY